MKGVLNVLAGVVILLTVIGGPAVFFGLRAGGIEWALCFGIAVAGSLNCLILAAVLLAMAEGLGLMERVTGAVVMAIPKAVRLLEAMAPKGQSDARGSGIATVAPVAGERTCPRCKVEYGAAITHCPRCGTALDGTERSD